MTQFEMENGAWSADQLLSAGSHQRAIAKKLPLFDDCFHSVRDFAKPTLQANTKIHITV
jgi:hypothetical protein